MEDQLIILCEIPGRTTGEHVQVLFVNQTADINWTESDVTIRMDWSRKSDNVASDADGIWIRQGAEFITPAHRLRSKRVASAAVLQKVLEEFAVLPQKELSYETSYETASWRKAPDLAGTYPVGLDLSHAIKERIDQEFYKLDSSGSVTLPRILWENSIFPRLL